MTFRIKRSSCVHRAFIVRSALALRSRSTFAHRSAFTYHSPTCVQRLDTVHSAFAQRSFSIHPPFAHHSSGKVERFRDCSNSDQGRVYQIVNFMTPWAGVLKLGRGHMSYNENGNDDQGSVYQSCTFHDPLGRGLGVKARPHRPL